MPMIAHARARGIRMSARKARLVADQIRGQTVSEALHRLRLSRKRAAVPLGKVLRSAVANAEDRHPSIDTDTLRIESVTVDGGSMLKRWRPRAYGRATQILHRSCHITIKLAGPDGAAEG